MDNKRWSEDMVQVKSKFLSYFEEISSSTGPRKEDLLKILQKYTSFCKRGDKCKVDRPFRKKGDQVGD